MADSNDAEVQNALNPNPSNLDENDPNVARDPVCGMLVDKRTAPDTMSAPVNDKGVGTHLLPLGGLQGALRGRPGAVRLSLPLTSSGVAAMCRPFLAFMMP